jgi:hypothetical protein
MTWCGLSNSLASMAGAGRGLKLFRAASLFNKAAN